MIPEAEWAIDEACGVTEATRNRALGWAVAFGVMFLEAGLEGDSGPRELGRQILDRVERYQRARGRIR